MADVQKAESAFRRVAGDLIEFGVLVNGVFHPHSAVRSADFDERQQAGEQENAQNQPQGGEV
jgi:hypothetical protein